MHEMNIEDLKDFIGRIIKDEPNYWITVFYILTPRVNVQRSKRCIQFWKIYYAHSPLSMNAYSETNP